MRRDPDDPREQEELLPHPVLGRVLRGQRALPVWLAHAHCERDGRAQHGAAARRLRAGQGRSLRVGVSTEGGAEGGETQVRQRL